MKIRTRIAAAVTAVVATLFVATPAVAAEPQTHVGTAQYSTAGTPVDIVAIAIVMFVLLIVVIGASQLVGNLFEKKD